MQEWAHQVPSGLERSMEAASSGLGRQGQENVVTPLLPGQGNVPTPRAGSGGWATSCGWMGLGRVAGSREKLGIVSC